MDIIIWLPPTSFLLGLLEKEEIDNLAGWSKLPGFWKNPYQPTYKGLPLIKVIITQLRFWPKNMRGASPGVGSHLSIIVRNKKVMLKINTFVITEQTSNILTSQEIRFYFPDNQDRWMEGGKVIIAVTRQISIRSKIIFFVLIFLFNFDYWLW